MRLTITAIMLGAGLGTAAAQDRASPSAPPGHAQPTQGVSNDPAHQSELDRIYADVRARQDAKDREVAALWEYWTFAVCVGCGGAPNGRTSMSPEAIRLTRLRRAQNPIRLSQVTYPEARPIDELMAIIKRDV